MHRKAVRPGLPSLHLGVWALCFFFFFFLCLFLGLEIYRAPILTRIFCLFFLPPSCVLQISFLHGTNSQWSRAKGTDKKFEEDEEEARAKALQRKQRGSIGGGWLVSDWLKAARPPQKDRTDGHTKKKAGRFTRNEGTIQVSSSSLSLFSSPSFFPSQKRGLLFFFISL